MRTKNAFVVAVVFLVAVSISQSCDKAPDNKPVAEKKSTRSEYVAVDDNVNLHVTDIGNGPVVVLLHGYPLSDAMYEYQYHALEKEGYRAIGITLRGFGQSDKPYGKYDYDQFARDIKVVLEKLDIRDATLGGYSMGGAIALHYVANFNEDNRINKLALFAAAGPKQTKSADYQFPLYTTDELSQWIALNNADRPALLGALGEKFTYSATSLTPGIIGWLGGIEMQTSPYAMEQALIALRDEDLRADLPKIQMPTLIFNATGDRIVAFALAEQLHKAIKGSVLVPFDKSGHALFVEEKDKFNAELIKFLKSNP